MEWLAGEDQAAAESVLGLLGRSDRECVRIWRCERGISGQEDWVSLVNAVAAVTPGTLAHQAVHDARLPERFRTVAPTFEALGWRLIDAGDAALQLTAALADQLLGGAPARPAEAAAAAATAFVGVFGDDAAFLCNVDGPTSGSAGAVTTGSFASACPLTPAVAEAGVVAIGGGRAGLLWVSES